MTPLMPELHQELISAARRRVVRPHRLRSPRRGGLIAIAAVLASGSAVAASSWRPQLGDDDRGHPTAAVGDVPADQLTALGVLRREQTDGDRGPRVQAALKLLVAEVDHGVHVDAVRILSEHPRGALVLVPKERVGAADRQYPAAIADKAVRHDVLCVMQVIDQGAGGTCGSVTDLRDGRIRGTFSVGASAPTAARDFAGGELGSMRSCQLVPDGVARVEVTLHDDSTHLVDVRDNAAELPLPDIPHVVSNIRTRWLDPTGQEVRKQG